jgi:hypothetical protein
MDRGRDQIRVELQINGVHAKGLFRMLRAQAAAVESALGYPLDWEELPDAQDSRISCTLNEADPEDEADWPRQHDWLARRLNELHRVFAQRVKALDVNALRSDAA